VLHPKSLPDTPHVEEWRSSLGLLHVSQAASVMVSNVLNSFYSADLIIFKKELHEWVSMIQSWSSTVPLHIIVED
jgi:hypothetical protein